MNKNLFTITLFILCAIQLFAQSPAIISFSPSRGPVGTLVTITGTNLGSPTAFTIGGVPAIVVSDNGSTLTGLVMPGATSGALSIMTAGGTATGSDSFFITPDAHPIAQQGPKLVSHSSTTYALQGRSVSISANGNTAIVGGYNDSANRGAAYIYVRRGTSWSQQGPKLLGTGASGTAYQGFSVSISADGNTAIVGGYGDSNTYGAAWIYSRTGNTWSQQGPKLVGSGASGNSWQGYSVSLSADGNTAIVGGIYDNSHTGAAWVFVRSGSSWAQQGNKLVGSGSIGASFQGYSVSLSADGNTAMVGAPSDSNNTGAAWVYTRAGSSWSQQGSKIVGTGAIGFAKQGSAVSLSTDGNTAMVGGNADSLSMGAVWVYTRSGTTWTQQGRKLSGTGTTGFAEQGSAVALSADGNTAIIGGPYDSVDRGAIWVFTRSGTAWSQSGPKLIGTGSIYYSAEVAQGLAVALSADGTTAIVGGPNDSTSHGAAWVFSTGAACYPGSSTLTHSICTGQSYNGHTTPGFYHDTLTIAGGCDSVVTLTLTLHSATSSAFAHSICAGSSYAFGSQMLTTAGSYQDTLVSAGGCDSVVTLTLAVSSAPVSAYAHSICAGSSYTFGSRTLTAAGSYQDTVIAAGGCDSIVTLTLSVLSLPAVPVIARSGDTLDASAAQHYQWYDDGTIINGDTSAVYIVSQNGNYTVQVSDSNACSSTSASISVMNVGIENIAPASTIYIYPNPASESFTIHVAIDMTGSTYSFSDMTGRVIKSSVVEKEDTNIDLHGLASGVYIVQVNGVNYKLIKQ